MVRPLIRGGVRARPLRGKKTFFYIFIYFSPKIVEKFFYCQNPFPAILRRKKNMSLTCSVKNFAQSIFSECTFHALFETHIRISPVHPFWTPSGLFSVALKLFELLTYNFGTLVWISPLDQTLSHFSQYHLKFHRAVPEPVKNLSTKDWFKMTCCDLQWLVESVNEAGMWVFIT